MGRDELVEHATRKIADYQRVQFTAFVTMGKRSENNSSSEKELVLNTKAIFLTKNTILSEFVEDLGVDLQTD